MVKASQNLDKVVDSDYSKHNFDTDAKPMEFLFDLYEHYTKDLLKKEKKPVKKKSKKAA